MRSFLLSLIPIYALVFGVEVFIYSYTGQWPNIWVLLASVLLGVFWGSKDLLL